MLTKRLIACLDVQNGRTVKGTNFVNLRDAGDPVALAARYAQEGIDELVLLDITATVEKRRTLIELVRNVAREVNIPFTVGGGIGAVADVEALLLSGADKVSLNSSVLREPGLIDELARRFGSQAIVVAVDARQTNDPAASPAGHDPAAEAWEVFTHGGRRPAGREAVAWCREAAARGAGEILLTSMSHDGTRDGYALGLTSAVAAAVGVPVIASGGAGAAPHFRDVLQPGGADAALAASVFHFGDLSVAGLKNYLLAEGVAMRPVG
ncbi:imidazole glycerol phosphate synthase subunit HisF [Hymenobacter cheonanensis]|uniref:imidazole glycerol phosphate synthase subunit HisF n=1 Tax=Hymenobacter sp. CA2-7 TaxID=3063993 RepID=UPI002712BF60|nr:imidazole glycerol phosphate synthase subunit HisF [Hymenobacter sp. CA2-7]MDO7886309.1 imidazole glycerol phosphate synthase subunit HisF [Hymenobacter sp. CA2-7]